MKHLLALIVIIFLISSCQKEIIDSTVTPPVGGGGTTNGELLIKGVSIAGTDTTIINLQWDSNKRLLQYLSSGKTNGVATDSKTDIIRTANGNIQKILSHPLGASGVIDSIVTYPFYQSGSSKISYLKDIKYTLLGNLQDSVLFTYNSAGKISVKETYSENFLSGVLEKQSKNNYTYDAQASNLVTVIVNTADANGIYTMAQTITNTYDSHLAPFTVAEEAFLVSGLGEETVSINNPVKKTIQSSGGNFAFTYAQQQFNTFDRTTTGIINVTPVPPGYTVKYTFYYQ